MKDKHNELLSSLFLILWFCIDQARLTSSMHHQDVQTTSESSIKALIDFCQHCKES